MKSLLYMISRNNKIFFRRRANFFFATLAVLILIGLHFMIFRNMYTDTWTQITRGIPYLTVSRTQLLWLNDSFMFAAVMPIGAISISLVVLSLMISDRERGVLNDFLVSPFSKNKLLLSYLLSSFFIGAIICAGFITFFEIYFLSVYGFGFSVLQILYIILSTMGCLLFGNVFMLLFISFIKAQQSVSAIGAITGTLSGFFCGAYVPVSMFGAGAANVMGCLPFLQLTALSKQAFMLNVEKHTPFTWDILNGDLGTQFGYQVKVGGTIFSLTTVGLFAAAWTILLLLLLLFRFSRLSKKD